jgi:hypothetical protein
MADTEMHPVTQDEFFAALTKANSLGADPMPSRLWKDDAWRCQKSGRLFGWAVSGGIMPTKFFLPATVKG